MGGFVLFLEAATGSLIQWIRHSVLWGTEGNGNGEKMDASAPGLCLPPGEKQV